MTDVYLPDGTLVRNVPEGMTKQQVGARYQGQHGTDAWLKDTSPIAGNPPDPFDIKPVQRDIPGALLSGLGRAGQIGVRIGADLAGGFVDTASAATKLTKANFSGEKSLSKALKGSGPPGSLWSSEPFLGSDYLKSLLPEALKGPEPSGAGKVAEFLGGALAGPRGKVPGGGAELDSLRRLLQQVPELVTTPGMRGELSGSTVGKFLSGAEQKLTSLPIVGNLIERARGKASEQFSQNRLGQGASTVGRPIPKFSGPQAGEEAMAASQRAMEQEAAELLPQLKGSSKTRYTPFQGQPRSGKGGLPGQVPPPVAAGLHQDLASLEAQVLHANLPQEMKDNFIKIIDRDVLGRFDSKGDISGENLAKVMTELRQWSRHYAAPTAGAERTPHELAIAKFFEEAGTKVDEMIERENPKELVERYRKFRTGYRQHEVASSAAEAAKGQGGNFSANRYLTEVQKNVRKQEGKSAARSGEGLNEQ
ncbi:MAG TPA: hypothetical protein VN648_21925, partial [Candidatus Methylomirabilis sp.]|nr:hypothetical protein [Candidatus Methylomirabilis sp.]